jgi:hypothetical protein
MLRERALMVSRAFAMRAPVVLVTAPERVPTATWAFSSVEASRQRSKTGNVRKEGGFSIRFASKGTACPRMWSPSPTGSHAAKAFA